MVAKARAVPEARPTHQKPVYRFTCLDCQYRGERIEALSDAEEISRIHAELAGHHVRVAMDLTDIEIEVVTGEERRD
jgi:predicted nucleic acid-binding Zn ribbon protein